MPLLLLMLLAVISLIIILVGFILSNNQTEQVPRQRTVYRTPYYVDRSGRRLREPMRASRVQVVEYTEQRSLIDFWQSLSVHRIFNRRIGEPTPWMGITLILLSVFLLCICLKRFCPVPHSLAPSSGQILLPPLPLHNPRLNKNRLLYNILISGPLELWYVSASLTRVNITLHRNSTRGPTLLAPLLP